MMTTPDPDPSGLHSSRNAGTALLTPPEPEEEPATAPAIPPGRRRGLSVQTFSALSNPNFRLLYCGNMLQFGAMQMQMLVRGVLVYDLTGSFAALGMVSLANAIPGLIFSLLGGVVADRAPKKTVIQTAQVINMVNAAVLSSLAGFGVLRFEHLLASAVMIGAVNAIMMPSRQSIIPDLVGREKLMNAVALNTSAQNLMQLIGPGIGGAMLAFASPAAVFGVNSALYFGAVTFTFRLPKKPLYSYGEQNARAGVVKKKAGGLRDIVEGLKYVGHDKTIRTLIAVNFLIVTVSMPYSMMLPGFVKDVLHEGSSQQGILMSISGVGAMVGSLFVASSSGMGRGKLFMTYATLLGFALIAFSLSTNFLVTMPIMLLIGAGTAGRMSLGQVLIQSYSADEYRGRVMAVWMMQFNLVAFGTFGAGMLAEWVGPQLAIGGMACWLVIAMALVAVFIPSFRKMD